MVSAQDKIEVAGFVLDKSMIRATYEKQAINLTLRQFRLLELLLENVGKPLSREYLKEKVWGEKPPAEDNSVDAEIGRLRRELQKVSDKSPVRTIRNVGFLITLTLPKTGPKFSGRTGRYASGKGSPHN